MFVLPFSSVWRIRRGRRLYQAQYRSTTTCVSLWSLFFFFFLQLLGSTGCHMNGETT